MFRIIVISTLAKVLFRIIRVAKVKINLIKLMIKMKRIVMMIM